MNMRRILLAGVAVAALSAGARRVTDLSGDDWRIDGEPGTVPHTWNAEDGADGFGDTRQVPSSSDGYERKRVVYSRVLPDPTPGKRTFIRCEGASIRAEVKVNGRPVGSHVGAFTAFVVDATAAMQSSSNVLEIAVDNFVDRDVPPVSADFTVYGGLYRKVELIETDELRFDSTPDGGPGLIVAADPQTGAVRVTPRVVGGRAPQYALRIEGPGLDRPISVRGLSATVPSPKLWTPETPNVYTLTAVVHEGEQRDKVTLAFGFRSVAFDADGRFRLNGEVRRIRGVNYHQDREGKGWAVSEADQDADIALVKELGADGIRTAHYPHAPHVYDLCDRKGLLAWLEMPNVNVLTPSEAYRRNALRLVRETIAQHRHHPSVFVWSTSNEVKLIGDEKAKRFATDLQRELDALAHELDASRPTTLATFKPLQREYNAIPTSLGFNFYPGWYSGTADQMAERIDEAIKGSPEHPVIAVSEYGAGSTPGQHEVPNVRSAVHSDFHSEEYAAAVHHRNYRTLSADSRIWGTFVWVMFDFASDTRHEGGRYGLNDKGLVGFDHRTLKEPYYLYRANWRDEPMLHLVGERLSVTTNESVRVMAFSTVGDVTLEVNGARIGTASPDAVRTAVWDGVKLRDGDNRIRISAADGRSVEATWRLAHPVTLHVAPGGSDAGDGSAERPFATPVRARGELRALRKAGRLDAGATVVFADGEYRLAKPLELSSEDSGTARFPVVWKAEHRGRAVFTGGASLTWRPLAQKDPAWDLLPSAAHRKVLAADIPGTDQLPGFRSVGCFTNNRQRELVETPLALYQGDARLTCARWPNDGWAKIGKPHGTNIVMRGSHERMYMDGVFEFHDRPRLERWAQEPDLWFHGLWYFQWADTNERSRSIDAANGLIGIETVLEEWGIREGNDFFAFNAFSELDAPGEWVVDRTNRKVYVWPLEGSDAPVELAHTENLIRARDVSRQVLDGLVFSTTHADAVVFERSDDVAVLGSTVRHTGGWGIRFDGGSRDRVDGCDLFDLGEGGIFLGGGDEEKLIPARHQAINCHIHHYGRRIPNYRPGVDLDGVGCRAERNLVHHSDHQAIRFRGNDHYIGYNICHDLCMHNDDAGSIYGYMCDLTKRGTVIEYNVVHMTGNQPRAYHTDSIYLDAWTSGVTVRGNLLNRAPQGVWASGGQATRIERNVIMNCVVPIARGNLGKGGAECRHVWSKGWKSSLMQRLSGRLAQLEAPPWRGRYRRLHAPLELEDAELAHASLWCEIVGNAFIGCGQMYCHSWGVTGPYTTVDGNRDFDGDPGFVDYAGFDWRLKPDSPMRTFLGGDTKFDRMGLFESPTRASKPVKFAPDATPPRPLVGEFAEPVSRIDLTFEGALPEGSDRPRRRWCRS